jgi:hypothetical protein
MSEKRCRQILDYSFDNLSDKEGSEIVFMPKNEHEKQDADFLFNKVVKGRIINYINNLERKTKTHLNLKAELENATGLIINLENKEEKMFFRIVENTAPNLRYNFTGYDWKYVDCS